MRPGPYISHCSFHSALLIPHTLLHLAQAVPHKTPLNIARDDAPAPEDGPSVAAGASQDTSDLPVQIGGIAGSYAISLVIVAVLLLILAKRRRQRLLAGEEPPKEIPFPFFPPPQPNAQEFPYPLATPKSPFKNFTSIATTEKGTTPYTYPSSLSERSTLALGVNPQVNQDVVAADREMAQQQLEEMYKYVMEQEAAKEAGVALDETPAPISQRASQASTAKHSGILKKPRSKPAGLDLSRPDNESEKTQSRTSSMFSALMSPRKKAMKGVSISSPIMTPMSGTFPPQEGEEMNAIPPRHYAPPAPPPVPMGHDSYAPRRHAAPVAPITPPDISPESTMSIDERLEKQMAGYTHSREVSQAATFVSEASATPLVGLPSSPKPGVNRFPSLSSLPASPKPGQTFNRDTLPLSPKPGATFARPNAPSAVRTGGSLPLRAFEPSLASPSLQSTKQTTFERAPMSPGGPKTPFTGAAVPYTPYQPFSPVIPMTPSLVTKADRKRMKALAPKTPTVELVQKAEDVW